MKTVAFGILPWLVLGCGGASSDLFQELAVDAGAEDARPPPVDAAKEPAEDAEPDAGTDAATEADVTDQDAATCNDSYLALDGSTGSYARIANTAAAPLNLRPPFTVEAWFKLEEGQQRIDVIKRGLACGWLLGVGENHVASGAFSVFDHVVSLKISGTGWRHVAWTYDGATSRLFLDGKLLNEKVSLGATAPCTQATLIGALYDRNGNITSYHAGQVDELRASNVIRYSSTFVPAVRHESDAATLGLWRFDETGGPALVDDSGRGSVGELMGAGAWREKDCDR